MVATAQQTRLRIIQTGANTLLLLAALFIGACAVTPQQQSDVPPTGVDSPGTFLQQHEINNQTRTAPHDTKRALNRGGNGPTHEHDKGSSLEDVAIGENEEAPVALNFAAPTDEVFTSEDPVPTEPGAEDATAPIADAESLDDDVGDNQLAAPSPTTLSPPTPRPGDPDIWRRVIDGYALDDMDHPRAVSHRRWYVKNHPYLTRTFERARPFLLYIVEEIERRGIPLEIALLPVVESAFQPFAYSHGKASGVWQFIASTGTRYGLKINWWYDGRRDIMASTHAALDYLQHLHDRFDNDWLLALAAYNSGEGTVARAIRANRKLHKPTDYWNLKLPKETAGYVPRLLAVSHVVQNAEQYGLKLPPISTQPYLAEVNIDSQIDVALAAELAGLPIDDIYRLNAGLNRWATDPAGPHTLILPVENVAAFRAALAQYPAHQRVTWARHTIKSGDNLISIAKHYRTTPQVIRETNNLEGSFIRAGKQLIIPVAQQSAVNYTLSAEQRIARTQSRSHGNKKTTHTVVNGDSLWSIARRNKISTRQLAAWNAMATRDILKIGQTLVIWKSDSAASMKSLAMTDVRPPTGEQRINYTVRKGDSLARIAQRFNTTVAKIEKWNDESLKKKKYLQPGQTLKLYIDPARIAES